jgi:hypothetical protein
MLGEAVDSFHPNPRHQPRLQRSYQYLSNSASNTLPNTTFTPCHADGSDQHVFSDLFTISKPRDLKTVQNSFNPWAVVRSFAFLHEQFQESGGW